MSPQHLYQYIQEYTVIVLTNISYITPSDKLIPNIIYIIFWMIICMVSIK